MFCVTERRRIHGGVRPPDMRRKPMRGSACRVTPPMGSDMGNHPIKNEGKD